MGIQMLRFWLLLLLSTSLWGEAKTFRFSWEKDDVLIVDKYQDIRVHEQGRTSSREEKNRIVLKVTQVDEAGAVMAGGFDTYSRSPRLVGEFRRDRDFASSFRYQKDGETIVSDQYVMPNLRSLPRFPERALSPGDTWQLAALETMDFGPVKLRIPLDVGYELKGETPLPEDSGIQAKLDEIQYTYSFRKRVTDPSLPFVMIVGHSFDRIWFDTAKGAPVFDTNRLTYTFYMRDGRVNRMAYRIDSWWKKIKQVREEEKKQIAEEADKEIGDTPNLAIRQTPEGVVIDLNSILFDTDSDKLSPAAKEDLQKLAAILKKYPDREIRVSGHTDSTGAALHNQRLSENRARSVVRSLVENGLNSRQLSYKGFGATRPAAPNDTAEGRARNRRVEVLIVTE
jgi:outer membrane protein OmpA-like peptidoglycan-associated protein